MERRLPRASPLSLLILRSALVEWKLQPGVPRHTCGAALNAISAGTPQRWPIQNSNFLAAGTGWGDSQVGIITGPGQWNSDIFRYKKTRR